MKEKKDWIDRNRIWLFCFALIFLGIGIGDLYDVIVDSLQPQEEQEESVLEEMLRPKRIVGVESCENWQVFGEHIKSVQVGVGGTDEEVIVIFWDENIGDKEIPLTISKECFGEIIAADVVEKASSPKCSEALMECDEEVCYRCIPD